ncbi:MAG: ADP-forming succinate--CoA ligase subunit beta, partial [Gammaproteobacteria bacterium]|nr:ADP-forming succinate--CoA ligase subunit beta [Gammaproteobacteria bacterium]
MNIHEYQAKQLLARYGLAVPDGGVATTPDDAEAVAIRVGGEFWAVKAQVHAGARGQAGGVKLAHSSQEVAKLATSMLGSYLVTTQTAPKGSRVNHVYIERGCKIDRELFLSVVVDPRTASVTALASRKGGADVEQVAAALPEAIVRKVLPARPGVPVHAATELAAHLGLAGEQVGAFQTVLDGVQRAFVELDATLIEVNPLALTTEGELVCLDIKMAFDDNALFRHPDIEQLRDERDELDFLERERFGFNYVQLNGDVGCLVTGAGLALATIDLVKVHGGEPANFLDLPPVATRLHVAAAFRQILANSNVKAILINAV